MTYSELTPEQQAFICAAFMDDAFGTDRDAYDYDPANLQRRTPLRIGAPVRSGKIEQVTLTVSHPQPTPEMQSTARAVYHQLAQRMLNQMLAERAPQIQEVEYV